MINFTHAFDLAWERMLVILFRPFDLGKWCAIGFSAFLAGFLSGGNGFTGSFNRGITHALSGLQAGLIILIVVMVAVIAIAFILLIYWLGARGQFMFLDNIVRNRGAISGPWHHYARQANSLFGFYLLVMVISLIIAMPFIAIVVLAIMAGAVGVSLTSISFPHWSPTSSEIAGMIVISLVYAVFLLVISCILFLFREFGVPLMFRQGLLAQPAFWATLKLIQQRPGSVAIFVLLRIAISVAVAILSLIICCATCYIGMIPYVGTVILLPVLVYVRCFTLDCLAQFGPQYDVWTVDVAPPPVGIGAPFSPQRPPG